MESKNRPSWLEGREIHGFHTIDGILNEAGSRWLRPNEIHAMLFNHTHFPVNAKPVNLPQSGTIVFFDRKVLRNFRKDGHNWKKKRDGKTVKEAHEHLKVGSEERIHVYYAHGEDNPNFVRRCYWLLDKSLEHIVLVHYRETTQEIQGTPTTPLNSQSASDESNFSASRFLPDETNYVVNDAFYADAEGQLGHRDDKNMSNHEKKLRELNTLEWDELLASNSSNNLCTSTRDNYTAHWYDAQSCQLFDHNDSRRLKIDPDNLHLQSMECQMNVRGVTEHLGYIIPNSGNTEDILTPDVLPNQDSFGIWMNDVIADSPGSVDNPVLGSSLLTNHVCDISSSATNLTPVSHQVFHIVEISHSWVPLTEDTKILVIGNFCEKYKNLERSNLFCVYGDTCVPAEVVQVGVYRCLVSHNTPGLLNLYLSLDGREPISQVINFEFRALSSKSRDIGEDKSAWDGFHIQRRLAHLLLSTCKTLEISDNQVSQKALKEATRFSHKFSNIRNSWSSMNNLIENNQMSLSEAKERLFEVTLKNRLKDWLLERVVLGSKISECDGQGQGVLHLCAILGYTWAVYPFSVSGLSLDFRDKFGWTALHWAAYCGRKKMVGALLSAGAKPNSVTDPIHNNPGGFTAADLALKKGYEGLAAYLSEKALVQQFQDMKLAGHVSGSLELTTNKDPNPNIQCQSNLNYQGEDEIMLKDTLAAYRTAADAAARIQVAFRERSFKIRAKAIHSTDEMEARYVISAMRIQHAYRKYEMKKQMAAAVRIQYGFQTWKLRREFLRMRQLAIKIQAAFRGYQLRRQYNKVLWSVGIVEKAILRWRLRRKGFRGFQVKPDDRLPDAKQEEISCEEDFFRAGRRQAEERVEKAVVRVQAMFRSKKVQEEYRRIKLAHDQAKLDYLRGSD